MALTPEQVKTQKFTITQYRDGYDLDQVDEFLDQIVADLEARDAEKAQLEAKVAELTKQLENAQKAEPAKPESAEKIASSTEGDAQKSSAMLQLALELHDKYVHEGEVQRDKLVREGEEKARELVDGAQQERTEVLKKLSTERQTLSDKIVELREFESEYRNTLRSYIQSQLRGLEGSPEPSGAPELKEQ